MTRDDLHNYVLAQMDDLVARDIYPTFSAFQCTEYWQALRQEMSLERKQQLIYAWDYIYSRFERMQYG